MYFDKVHLQFIMLDSVWQISEQKDTTYNVCIVRSRL